MALNCSQFSAPRCDSCNTLCTCPRSEGCPSRPKNFLLEPFCPWRLATPRCSNLLYVKFCGTKRVLVPCIIAKFRPPPSLHRFSVHSPKEEWIYFIWGSRAFFCMFFLARLTKTHNLELWGGSHENHEMNF